MAEYIEREAAVSSIMKKERHDFPADYFPDDEYAFNDGLVVAANALDEVPAADVVPVRHGRWVWDGGEDMHYFCSLCNYNVYGCTGEILSGDYKYCPNCGAKMDGDEVIPAADVVTVVRCGECKWSDKYGLDLMCQKHSGITKNKLGEDIHFVEWHSKNFFCADGERRDAK